MLALSFVCHLAVFSLIVWINRDSVLRPSEEPVTYVDVVTLPVAAPQAGTPAPAEPAPPAAPAAAPPKSAMVTPSVKPKAKTPPPVQGKTAKPQPGAEESQEFNERMAKLERQAEERRQADVIARLKGGAGKKVGMPGAKGNQAGSDYGAYLQSRLKDAFKEVIASQSGAPQALVRITVGPDGRITNYRMEKRSGDPVFDDAVSRAVTLAGRSFRPPPSGQSYERVFRFKPEGVGLP